MTLTNPIPEVLPAVDTLPEHRVGINVPLSHVKPLIKLLSAQGVSISKLINGTHLSFTDFVQPEKTLSVDQYLTLLKNARQFSPDPAIGLALGQQFFFNHEGLLSSRVMSSENIGQALTLLMQYQHLFTWALSFEFQRKEGGAVLMIRPEFESDDALPLLVEYVLSSVYEMGRFCTGHRFFPLVFEFSYPDTGMGAAYRQLFGLNIRFDCDETRVFLPEDLLKQPLLFSDQESAEKADEICRQKMHQFTAESSTIQRVKALLKQGPLSLMSLDYLAEAMHVTPRTLRRHLSAHQVNYKTLLENERKRLALSYIAKSSYSVDRLADELGYKDASSFSRAFKRWYGVSPNQYKGTTEIRPYQGE